MELDIAGIRAAVADQIREGVERDVNVYGGYVPDSPTPPCILVVPDDDYIDFHATFSNTGLAVLRLRVSIFCPTGPSTDGQRVIDGFLSAGTSQTNSVLDAILADPTFGGAVAGCRVVGAEFAGRVPLTAPPEAQAYADAAAVLLEIQTNRS